MFLNFLLATREISLLLAWKLLIFLFHDYDRFDDGLFFDDEVP